MVDTQDVGAGFGIIVEGRDRGRSKEALELEMLQKLAEVKVSGQMLRDPVVRLQELEFVEHPRFQHPRFQHPRFQHRYLSPAELSPLPRCLPLLRPRLLPWLDSDSRGFQLKKWLLHR